MKFKFTVVLLIFVLGFSSCENKDQNIVPSQQAPFVWDGANLYFMLVDRFNNGTSENDQMLRDPENQTGVLRGFEGGDLRGVIEKIKEGYFDELGINAIWMSPIVEQIHGATDEGTGLTEGYHGYWTRDWTAIDPNFGTEEDLKELVDVAHEHGIRIVLDAVINHTGPVTEEDSVWPADWVRTSPACKYQDYNSTVSCTLVENLPDILTNSDQEVALPHFLMEKWENEGRLDQEIAELDAFFEATGYPRAPRFYIMKWLSDYISDYGIDGYRVDTVKHVEESVWSEFKDVCDVAFADFKINNPEKVLDDNSFYLVGEVYNYSIGHGKAFDFGDHVVNYFDDRFESLINFEFRWNAEGGYEELFSRYSSILNGELQGYGVLNYIDSHDDGNPFDVERKKSYEAATKLLLTPGTSQVYYGDETNRPLIVEGAVGDANLRSMMNWEDLKNNTQTQELYEYWSKLGQFRKNHPAIGAGVHVMISESPYTFSRNYFDGKYSDVVVIALDTEVGAKEISVGDVFMEGTELKDAYSGKSVQVKEGKVVIDSPYSVVLLEENI